MILREKINIKMPIICDSKIIWCDIKSMPNIWANIKSIKGYDRTIADKRQILVNYKMIIRYRRDIQSNWLILWREEFHEILAILPGSDKRYTDLIVRVKK